MQGIAPMLSNERGRLEKTLQCQYTGEIENSLRIIFHVPNIIIIDKTYLEINGSS
jgi:hypothetical protein